MIRNTVINLAGSVAGGVIAVLAVPVVVSRLGTDIYGAVALLLMVLGWGTIFDAGITPVVAREVARLRQNSNASEFTEVVSTAVLLQGLLGTLAALLLWYLAPVLGPWIFRSSDTSVERFTGALRVIAACFPLALVQGVLMSTLTGLQRFSVVSLLTVLGNSAFYIAMLGGAWLELELSGLAWLLVAAKMVLFVATAVAVRIYAALDFRNVSGQQFVRLAASGGSFAVAGLIDPVMFYIDRLIIGSVIGPAAVAYYVLPFELMSRIWIVSSAVGPVLFTSVARISGSPAASEIGDIYRRAGDLLILSWAPVALVGSGFGESILRAWVGPEVSGAGSTALRILLISSLLDVPGIVSTLVLGGGGNARVLATVKGACLPGYAISCVVLVNIWGVTGAAVALATLRVFYSVVFSALAMRAGVPVREVLGILSRAFLWSALSGGAWFARLVGESLALTAVLGALVWWAVAVAQWAARDREARRFVRAVKRKLETVGS